MAEAAIIDFPIQPHPLATLFPAMSKQEFDALVESIRQSGLQEPITLFEGKILDGCHRYRACQLANVKPQFEHFGDDDPIGFVVAKNIQRRHLNESQRGLIAARLATLRQGETLAKKKKNDDAERPASAMAVSQVAAIFHINRDTVSLARKVLAQGRPEQITAIENGTATVFGLGHLMRQESKRKAKIKLSTVGKNPERIERQRFNTAIWKQVRTAVLMLAGLPDAKDVAEIAAKFDRAGVVKSKIADARRWLEEFENVGR